jgi:hypothetical protein
VAEQLETTVPFLDSLDGDWMRVVSFDTRVDFGRGSQRTVLFRIAQAIL